MFDAYDKSVKCRSWPGPGRDGGGEAEDGVYLVAHMSEFSSGRSDHVDRAFERFKERHGKEYSDGREHETRKDIFRQNMRFIHSKNRYCCGICIL